MNIITEKLNRSSQLFKSSVAVLRMHPKLLVFPILTALLTLVIALFFLGPVIALLLAPHWLQNTPCQPVVSLFFAGLYLLNMFLATLSSVAFNSEIMEALAGRPVSIRHGIEAACVRWKSVLLWSLLAGTVG